jgi:diacylglycerol kinase (ATP)
MRAGVIRNPRSHAHRRGERTNDPAGALVAAPDTPADLARTLQQFKREGVDLLVIDGGDGTVREVLSVLPAAYATPPLLAVLPSGKTNILAMDLGSPKGWSAAAAAEAARTGRLVVRSPLEVRGSGPPMRGFFFGAAGFVSTIARSQKLHSAGVFQEAVVVLGLAGALVSLLCGGKGSGLGAGELLSLRIDRGEARTGPRLATLATTLERLPYGMQPFGPPRPGLKLLDVDAPPKRLPAALKRLMRGGDDAWLDARGYRRRQAERAELSLSGPYVLDGETYPAEDVVLTQAPPLKFVVP